MKKESFSSYRSTVTAVGSQHGQSPANLISNRVEALKVLSTSLLQEIEGMRIQESAASAEKIDLATEVERFQIDLIRTALLRTGGRQRAAARLLNVKATTLHAKIKRFGLEANAAGPVDD